MKSAHPFLDYKASSIQGIALVVTLLVIVVLTVAVTAFMQSMSLERRTSQAYLNILKADESVQAGLADATHLISNFKLTNPYYSIGYKNVASQMTPYLIGNADYNTNPTTNELRLVSGNPSNTTAFSTSNSIEMNVRKDASDQYGWMGSPIVNGSPAYRSQKALWVKLLKDNTLPEQPNPAVANYNPVISRYAFWIDDETCKLDIGVDGNASGASNRFARSKEGKDVTDLDISAIPMLGNAPLPDDATGGTILKNISDFRTNNPFFMADSKVLNRMSPGQLSATVADEVKFSATTFSKSDELAGTGRRRVNLNYLVTSSLNANKIAADLDDIGWVITGQHLLQSASPYTGLTNGADGGMFLDQPAVTGSMASFGNRFYTSPINPNPNAGLYVKKIAANIRDYIDTDKQPTILDATGVVLSESKPATGPSISSSNYQTVGKEAIPYLQEHAWRGLIESWVDTATRATGTIRFDHYFEFFNPSTKDFTAPTGAFLKLYASPTWTAGTFPGITPGDFELDLTNIVFPAGKVVVVTTNSAGSGFGDPPNMIKTGSQIERKTPNPATALRFINVSTDNTISTVKGFQLIGRSSTITDYKSRFLWGTPNGAYDSFPAISISLSNTALWNFTSRGNNVGSTTRFVYSSSMRGNDSESRSGDPRSLVEQINFLDYSSGGSSDQTRWFGNISGHSDTGPSTIPGTATFGSASISFITPTAPAPNNWKDYNPALADTAASAYAVIADTSLASIGELGNIYDPSRIVSSVGGSSILYARGGARTFKIGQADDLIPSARFAASGATTSWFNAAWRLADLFSADNATLPMSPSSKPGKLNINGILRDDGTALRAALRTFQFRPTPESDPTRTGAQLSATEIDNLIAALKTYVTNNGPLMERGEISQIPFFAGAGTSNTAGGSAGNVTNDRGREEIVRRIIELITTRSNSFSVYVIGESVMQDFAGNIRVKSKQARRFVIEMQPQNSGADLDNATSASKVDGYKIKTVHEISL